MEQLLLVSAELWRGIGHDGGEDDEAGVDAVWSDVQGGQALLHDVEHRCPLQRVQAGRPVQHEYDVQIVALCKCQTTNRGQQVEVTGTIRLLQSQQLLNYNQCMPGV